MMLARSGLFSPVELKQRVFQKIAAARRLYAHRPAAPGDARRRPRRSGRCARSASRPRRRAARRRPRRDRDRSRTSRRGSLFDLAQRDVGRPLKDLEVSYRPVELRSQIDKAPRRAPRGQRSATSSGRSDGRAPRVSTCRSRRSLGSDGAVVGVGISFVDVTRYKRLQEAVEHSKRDVETAYEELQSTVEELETTNEELQSTNEELETTNEELQSTNEELETMNEELHVDERGARDDQRRAQPAHATSSTRRTSSSSRSSRASSRRRRARPRDARRGVERRRPTSSGGSGPTRSTAGTS